MKRSSIYLGEQQFCYRTNEEQSTAFFWPAGGGYSHEFLPTGTIARAATKIKKITGLQNACVAASPAPEQYDEVDDRERIGCFNRRVIAALVALGADEHEAEHIFDYVGMPSEWRGAMWRAATIAERLPQRTQAHTDLMQRITTVCRFMPMTMTVDGSFAWSLAVGNRALADAVQEFHFSLQSEARAIDKDG